MQIEISNTKQVKSYYNTETCILYTEYAGFFNEDNAMEHFHIVENFVAKNLLLGIVADVRKLNGSYNKVMEYFTKEGYPKIKKAGLMAEAFIIGDDIMVNYLTNKLMGILKEHNIACNCFTTYKEADDWLFTKTSKYRP